MREIIFRGKRIDNGEWAYGYYIILPMGETVILSNKGYAKVYSKTVGQFTGLYDKNGTRIFEGDIVKEWSAWWRTPDKIESNTFEVVCKHLGTLLLIRKNRGGEESKTLNRNSTVEVIGTIYDNPELMEVEE